MENLEINLSFLLILLLPGFVSLWVFKRITKENMDKRGEWMVFVLGCCFGVADIASFSILRSLLESVWPLPVSFLAGGSNLKILFSPPFWIEYSFLSGIALFMGGFVAFLRAKSFWVPQVVANCVGKILNRPASIDEYETGFSYVVADPDKITKSTIMKVSNWQSNRASLVGTFAGESHSDILLAHTELFDPDGFPYGFKTDVCIDWEKGVVIEYVVSSIEDQQKFRNRLMGAASKRD
ncbi:MAG: hypothetical protein VB083_02745 [Aminobacterium sp.]|nr:hypothetical protein [Aminobacterium sp.]MEA4876805.1 hypothetical protein [Aminobacterium sp.]